MTFNEFYHRDYLARHANGVCKTLHVVGLPLAVVLGGVAVWLQIWWLLALLPVPVFLLAWLGHLCATTVRPSSSTRGGRSSATGR